MYVDIEDFDELLLEYDSNIACKVESDNILAILDSSSLLWRLHVSEEFNTILYMYCRLGSLADNGVAQLRGVTRHFHVSN